MSGEERNNHKADEVDVEKLDPVDLADRYGQMTDEEPITMKPVSVSSIKLLNPANNSKFLHPF
jgi:hypothetical protein